MKPTVFNSLRHLRITPRVNPKRDELACKMHPSYNRKSRNRSAEALHQSRLQIRSGNRSRYGWLMANDESLPLINNEGLPYAERDFFAAQQILQKTDGEDSLRPLAFYRHIPELKVIVAGDLLARVLQAAHKRNLVPQFIHRLEWFVRAEVSKFGDLQEEIYVEIRKHDWPKGGFLFPVTKKYSNARSAGRRRLGRSSPRERNTSRATNLSERVYNCRAKRYTAEKNVYGTCIRKRTDFHK